MKPGDRVRPNLEAFRKLMLDNPNEGFYREILDSFHSATVIKMHSDDYIEEVEITQKSGETYKSPNWRIGYWKKEEPSFLEYSTEDFWNARL